MKCDKHNKENNLRHRRKWILLCLLGILVPTILFGSQGRQIPSEDLLQKKTYPIKPTVKDADRHQEGKVFLERADKLWMDDRIDSNCQVLVGNVEFRKGDMFMYCDSAHFYDQEGSMQAFGNVRMEQGDTLFVYAEELDYSGPDEIAVFYGDNAAPVRLINRDVVLVTDVFNYNLADNIGYYDAKGTITDAANTLTSIYGQYCPDTKEAEFRIDVVLQDTAKRDFKLTTQELLYNTDTHIARIVSPSVIETDSATVYSSNGWYDTNTDKSELYDRSLVVTKRGNTLTGDTIFYDNKIGFGEAFGGMILTDSIRQSSIEGDYGCYFEDKDSAFATIRARALEYSKKDTLYLHGDTIKAYRLPNDTSHVITAYPRVRFWRVDMQGLCDSLSFQEKDSMMYMMRHPIVWNDKRQVFGNVINVHFNDSTVDWAKLPDFGFVAEHIDEEFYNQLSGKEMIAYFDNGDLRRLDVSGNVESIMLPQENDSTYNKMINSESSFMIGEFRENKLEKLTMWPEVTGTVTPLYLARKSIYYLSNFKWYESLRPKDKDDIFNIPPEMEALLKEPDPSVRKRKVN